jgi:hypothetical protein
LKLAFMTTVFTWPGSRYGLALTWAAVRLAPQ